MALDYQDEAVLDCLHDDPSNVVAHPFFGDHQDMVVDDLRDDRRDWVAQYHVDDRRGAVVGCLDDPWEMGYHRLADDHRDVVVDGRPVDRQGIAVVPRVVDPRHEAVDHLIVAHHLWVVWRLHVDCRISRVDLLFDDGWSEIFARKNPEIHGALDGNPYRDSTTVASRLDPYCDFFGMIDLYFDFVDALPLSI